jgi:hypothetical protein
MSHGLSYGLKKSSMTVLGMQTGLLRGSGLGRFIIAWREKSHRLWDKRIGVPGAVYL